MVPKAMGMSTRLGAMFQRPESCSATGSNRAMAPTLFITADIRAPRPVSAAMPTSGPASLGSTRRVRLSTAPVSSSPRLSTSTAATVITAGWPNPVKLSAAGTRSSSTQASRAASATRSWRHRPQMKRAMVRPRIARS